MFVKIQTIHFDADSKLTDYVEQKVNKLAHYYHDIVECEVFLKLDHSDERQNKVAEIKVHSPGKTMFAKERSATFEEATNQAVDALRRQVKKHKEKIRRGM